MSNRRSPYMFRRRPNSEELEVDIAKALSLCAEEEKEMTDNILQDEEVMQLALAISQADGNPAPQIMNNILQNEEEMQLALAISQADGNIRPQVTMNNALAGVMSMFRAILQEVGEINNTGSLPEVYKEYRMMPTMFSEDHMWPLPAILCQQRELRVPRGTEEVRECAEGQDRCLVCLSNEATRVAVPCGHKLCCRLCVSELADKSFFYSVTSSDGQVLPTDRRIPVQCFTCRAIVGQIIAVHS